MFKFIYLHKIRSLFDRLLWKVFFSRAFRECGGGATIFSPDYIVGEEFISLQDDVYIGYKSSLIVEAQPNKKEPKVVFGKGTKVRRFFHLVCIDEIVLGDSVLIADKVFIADNIHGFDNPAVPIIDQALKSVGKVHIGDGACIGENVCIIGSKVGKNSTIGANSVVINDIPDYSVAVGIPAKVIKTFNFDSQCWERV